MNTRKRGKVANAGTELHDCTNEEQIDDEFERVDREEIFDEHDEKSSI